MDLGLYRLLVHSVIQQFRTTQHFDIHTACNDKQPKCCFSVLKGLLSLTSRFFWHKRLNRKIVTT